MIEINSNKMYATSEMLRWMGTRFLDQDASSGGLFGTPIYKDDNMEPEVAMELRTEAGQVLKRWYRSEFVGSL